MVRKIPTIVAKAIDRFIRDYRPTLFAFEHCDLGHKIRWAAPDHVVCSCGLEAVSG